MRRVLSLAIFAFVSLFAFSQTTREFTFHYAFSVRNVPAGEKFQVWFPRARSDQFQDVKIVSFTSDLPLKRTVEPKYGNAVFYAVAPKAGKSEYNFDVEYAVTRRERTTFAGGGVQPVLLKATRKDASRYLGPDKLVPVTGRLADLAAKQVQKDASNLDNARILYNYVFDNMRYDKSGTGWGRGDAEWACDAKRGNCTDFHSLFISMARSQGIPSRFEIGFPLPADKHSADLAGYHCWAEFYDARYGWVPVDISEAWKDQKKKDFFFGGHDVNRIQFSLGRDLVLTPRPAGEPLNYFIYPYVEVSGKKWENVSNHFSFADRGTSATAAGK
jgi:transglutaminase-like putative cysteine protease